MHHTAPRLALRAALACAALLGLAALPLAAPAGGTTPSCTTTANPLGAATGYTEFIAGSGSRGSESEGAIAWGGNLSAGGMTVGTRLPGSTAPTYPALVVAGTHGTYNLQRGSAYLNPKSGVNFNGGAGTGYLAANPIDFAAAFTDLKARSAAWGAAASTGTVTTGVTGGNAATILTGTSATLNVFNLTQADLPAGRHIGIDVPAGSVALINVAGGSISLTGQMWIRSGGGWQQASDGVMAGYPGILWNFPAATSITMSFGSAWGGSILAPNANLQVQSVGHTIGQIVAASFSSNFETHQNLFPASACLPGGGGGSDRADVQVIKTASKANPGGGSTFSYTLTARNNGPDKARNVTIVDALPLGVTFDSASAGCAAAGVIVTCDAGDLDNGAARTFTIGVIADPIGSGGSVPHPGQRHDLTIAKVEAQVDLNPGETRTVALACPGPGAILTDGSVRLDAVDQGAGALTDVHVVSARSTGLGTWEAVVANGATGRAQAKAFAVCLPATTESTGGHTHALVAAGALQTTTQAWGVGRQSATLTCPADTIAIVPGFALSGGAATVAGSEPTAGGWKLTFDVTAPTTATLSVRCLDRDVAAAQGHTHPLATQHVVRTVTIPAGQTVEEQVVCADDAKGIVGTWSLPPGVVSVGNDPRPKTRAFKLVNTTGGDQAAIVDLECLGDRTGAEQLVGASPVTVTNTATVSTASTDAVSGNDSASATVTVQADEIVGVGASAQAGATKLTLKAIASVNARPATIKVKSRSGTVWASGRTALKAGVAKKVRLRLTGAGRSALRSSSSKRGRCVIRVPAGSRTRAVTIRPA